MIHAMFPISSAVPASFPLQGPGAFVSCFYKYNRHFSSPEAIEKCLFFCKRKPPAMPVVPKSFSYAKKYPPLVE